MLLLISEINDEKYFIIRTYTIVEKKTSGVEGEDFIYSAILID